MRGEPMEEGEEEVDLEEDLDKKDEDNIYQMRFEQPWLIML